MTACNPGGQCPTDGSVCGACGPEVVAFRQQLGLAHDEQLVDGVQLDLPEADVPAPERTPAEVFGLGYSVGRSTVQAEQAAARVFARARRRRLVLDAACVGLGWFLGSWLVEQAQS